MIDKTHSLKKIQTDLEESECRIMGSEREMHTIYTTLKESLPWVEEKSTEDRSRNMKSGFSYRELALIHRFMFASAFESARMRLNEGPEASAQYAADILETVQSADFPSREFFNNYFKYENNFATKLQPLNQESQSAAPMLLPRIAMISLPLLLIIIFAAFLLNN